MRIELTIDGGFAQIPGLAKPIVLDGTRLTGNELAELRRLCHEALAAPDRDAEAKPVVLPDARRYRLTLEIDGERHEITAADPITEPSVAKLIDFLRTRGSR